MNSIVHILSNIEIYIYQEEIYKISNIISFLGIIASQNRSNLTNLCRWNCYKWSQEILSKNVIFKCKNYVPHLLLLSVYIIMSLKMSIVRNSFFRHVKKDLITKKGI